MMILGKIQNNNNNNNNDNKLGKVLTNSWCGAGINAFALFR